MKEVNTQNFRSFEKRAQEGVNVPIWVTIGFQQKDRQDSKNLNNKDTFHRPPVTSAQCILGTEKYKNILIELFLTFDNDECCTDYGQIKEVFSAL